VDFLGSAGLGTLVDAPGPRRSGPEPLRLVVANRPAIRP
jgi:hypothetical protein